MKNTFVLLMCLMVVDHSLCIKKKTIKLPPAASSALLQAVQQCMPQTGVTFEALLLVYQGGYTEDKKFKDFIFCCYKNAGYLKQNGRINAEKMIKLFSNDVDLVEGLRRCGEESGETAKQAVFNFFKCFQDTVPVRFTL